MEELYQAGKRQEQAAELFPRSQAPLGTALSRSSASHDAKQSFEDRHSQAELGNEWTERSERSSLFSAARFRLIDLSVPLENAAASEPFPAAIHYITHEAEGLEQMRHFFGVAPEDLVFSNGQGWAIEEIKAITHTGTHVDAPYHYGATSAG